MRPNQITPELCLTQQYGGAPASHFCMAWTWSTITPGAPNLW
jgi:hypothetical protein